MKLIAQRAREENRHSLDRAAQLIINANRFSQGAKPPLPPKYVYNSAFNICTHCI